jgi:NET1-associated nuclear protein 1 (U3 small nucleolar RNA-associated protein 17)
VHAASSTLVLPSSHPSSLQFVDPSTSKLVSELEVSPSNRVSRQDEEVIEPFRVNIVVISMCNQWMATVDSRDQDEALRSEISLKFWAWDSTNSRWTLNTRIDHPHGDHRVTASEYQPAQDANRPCLLVSGGADGSVKMWRLRAATGSENSAGAPALFTLAIQS